MNVTPDAVQPPYPTTAANGGGGGGGKSQGISDYLFVIGFFVLLLHLLALTFVSYICKRSRSPPPPPIVSFGATTYNEADHHRLITVSPGLDDDVLVTSPTFLYAQATITHKGDNLADATASDCSICLADYKPADIVRLLPECGHLFHVNCVDTWLKAHPTCPVCRNSPIELTGQ